MEGGTSEDAALGLLTLNHVEEVLDGHLVTSQGLLVVFGFVFLSGLAGEIDGFLRRDGVKEKTSGDTRDVQSVINSQEIFNAGLASYLVEMLFKK